MEENIKGKQIVDEFLRIKKLFNTRKIRISNLRTLDLPQQNQLLCAGLSQTKIADILLHATTISIFSC
jgi:hypothetical protein